MQRTSVTPQNRIDRARVRRRLGAVTTVASVAAGLVMVAASPAQATPVASAAFSGNATSSILALNDLSLGTTSIANAVVAASTASLSSSPQGSSATAANLDATVVGLPIELNKLEATAPPPETVGPTTLLPVNAAPLLNAGVLTGTAIASWPAVGTCPSATQPASTGSVKTAGATIGGLGQGLPSLVSTSDATARSTTKLVTASGPSDTRGVQASATNTISRIDLLGGSAAGGITITVNEAPVLTGTATGVTGTSSVVYTPAVATVTIGAGGTPTPLVAGTPVAIPLVLPGLLSVTASITLNGAATGVTNTGTSVSGDAALLSVTLNAKLATVQLANLDLDVAPLHVEAVSPASGIQCGAPAPTGTATGIDPNHGPTTGGQTVTIIGTCFVAGQTTVTIGGILIPASAITVAPDGKSLTFVTPPHAAGPVEVTVDTPCGTTAPPLTYTYDPVPPVITDPGDGSSTDDNTPPISGTGTPGDTVTVTEGGTTICTGRVNASGRFTCTPADELSCGSHTISATQEAPNGAVSKASADVTFTVNCAAPSSGSTADTGAPTRGLLLFAYLVMLLGALAFAIERRMRKVA